MASAMGGRGRRSVEVQVFERSESGRVVMRGTLETAYDRQRRGGTVVPALPRRALVVPISELGRSSKR